MEDNVDSSNSRLRIGKEVVIIGPREVSKALQNTADKVIILGKA